MSQCLWLINHPGLCCWLWLMFRQPVWKMTFKQVVETSVTIATNDSPSQDYTNPDDQPTTSYHTHFKIRISKATYVALYDLIITYLVGCCSLLKVFLSQVLYRVIPFCLSECFLQCLVSVSQQPLRHSIDILYTLVHNFPFLTS